MHPDGSLPVQIFLILILILINAFFAASEIAVISLSNNKIQKLSEDGNKKAAILLKLTALPSSFLAVIQVGVTLSGLLASAIASESFADHMARALAFTGADAGVLKVVSVAVITLFLSYFTLVFGELVPKRIALQNPEGVALGVAGVLNAIAAIFRPFVNFLAFSTNLIIRAFGIGPSAGRQDVTEEEILMMIDAGEENGVIEESEKEMINNVFEFNDKTAGEIMTHRTDIFSVEDTAGLAEILEIGLSEGYSRIPVYHEDVDDIVGVVFVKDLLQYVGKKIDGGFDVKDVMRPALFVPDTKRCGELFKLFTEKKLHIAVVVDEYGGTAGIVTMEDLVETIVGNIQDEYDKEEDEFRKIDESTFTIDGSAELDEVSSLLDVELPEGDYDTVGGLIIDRLGRIPDENEHPSVTVEGIEFTVDKVVDRRIEEITAVKKAAPEKDKKD